MPNNTLDHSDPRFKYYHGSISIKYYEELPDIAQANSFIRPIDNELQYSIRFPVSATFFLENQTFAQVDIKNFTLVYALVGQHITLLAPNASNYGTITIATLARSPFHLTNASVANTNPSLLASITSAHGIGK